MSTTLSRYSNRIQRPRTPSGNSTGVTNQWRALARLSFGFYCEYTHRGAFIPYPHTEHMAGYLEQVEQGQISRLILSLPPQHGKSMTVSETFPSWYMGRDPRRKVICVSYGDALAVKFGRRNREKINEFGREVWGIALDTDRRASTDWGVKDLRPPGERVENPGGMISAGIGGGITGEGADLLVIDDPIKNRQEADSETYRERVWSEYQNTLLTRLSATGAIIIIQTRWHEDDLVGRVLEQDPDRWVVVNLPCVAEEDDPLGRDLGQALWPDMGKDEAWAEQTRVDVGSRTWEALYQGRPSPAEGGIVKRGWWKYYGKAPEPDEVIQSWDCAFKDTKGSDFVVGQVWARKGANKYILDQVRGRMTFTETVKAVENLSNKWPQARAKLIEEKANGAAVMDVLKSRISGLIPIIPKESKEARAHAISPDIEAGNVFIPERAPWVGDFVEEWASFPTGKHDDQVDATTQALQRLGRYRMARAAKALPS